MPHKNPAYKSAMNLGLERHEYAMFNDTLERILKIHEEDQCFFLVPCICFFVSCASITGVVNGTLYLIMYSFSEYSEIIFSKNVW